MLGKHEIIIPSQYGFMKNRSTVHAISELIETISETNDENKFSTGTFIDLKRAFDTADYEILLDKLAFYGIKCQAHQ